MIEDSVKIGRMENEKLTGEACVLFSNEEDAQHAYNNRNQEHIGKRWIELFKVTASEYYNFEADQSAKFDRRKDNFGYQNTYGSGRGGRGGFNTDKDYDYPPSRGEGYFN